MSITGTTKLYFVIADPVDQVRAPEVFNHVFSAQGIDAAVVPLRVAPVDLEASIKTLFRSPTVGGIFLSIPHKPAAVKIVDHCSLSASVAGAVNAIRRNASGDLEGELFDGDGFRKSLDRAGIAYANRRVLMIGAGGAASAIATALAMAGAASISLYDPYSDKAEHLASLLREHFGLQAAAVSTNDPSGYELIINASPLGLKPDDPQPVDVSRIDEGAATCDVLMKNQPTPFLRAARARGLVAEPGFDMLIQQTPLYLDFFGYPEAADVVRRDDSSIRKLLYPAEMPQDLGRGANAAHI
jgi:shikimate dehydrogenase